MPTRSGPPPALSISTETPSPQSDSPERSGERSASAPELVERAQAGEKRAFELLYRARFQSISRRVGALVRDPDRTEDVVAQTFLLAWKDLPKLRRSDRFDSWLGRIAHNQAMTELRRRRTVPLDETLDPEDPSDLGSPPSMLELKHDIDEVREALLELPEEQREVLVLRFLQDLPHAEVARILNRSEQAARALQYRALRSMQRIMVARSA